jgi:2-polyprenyl-3-methyl-5-hydroxy-6-metoxy-1,4-benzoquinol methylase
MYGDTYAGASESYFRKVPQKLRRSRGRVRQLVRFLPGGAAGRSFLDVGCNGGFMVEAAREAGFAAWGVEPDGAAVAYARRHYPANTYIHGTLEEADLGGHQFDAVYCSEVIEHAADCNRFVAALARATRPGGILYLTTPDIGHWRRPRDVRRWDAFCPPAHCLYFSPGNLAQLLARHGFAVIRRRPAFKPGIKVVARRLRGAPAGG